MVIAYGQTGSGKTFTVQGSPKQPGIILRTIEYLEEMLRADRTLKVTCWMAEIYMQELTDLFFKPGDPVKPLWIKEDCTINGITLRTANSAQELEKAFDLGISNR